MVEQATVRVLHNGVVTERGSARDEEVDRLSAAVSRRVAIQVSVQSRGGQNAVRLHVETDIDNHALSSAHWEMLFAEGQQQILGQAPVEERSDVLIHADDFQIRKLANHRERRFGGGHEPVLGIAIDKDIQFVFGLEVRWNIAARQQDLAQLTAVEIEAGGGRSHDGESIAFADDDHGHSVSANCLIREKNRQPNPLCP
jgi:hypothetical protein